MFTGLSEEMGIVEKIVPGKVMHIVVRAEKVLKDCHVGDSIAINGVCLTAVKIGAKRLGFDVVQESQQRSTLSALKPGDGVNLERALALGTRLGGHIVSGHIDGTGKVAEKISRGEEYWLKILTEESVMRYLIPKGSVAIDGISLTIAEVGKDWFSIALIPHTWKETNLRFKEKDSRVNLEVDMLAKYVFRFFEQQSRPGTNISEDYLKSLGFDE